MQDMKNPPPSPPASNRSSSGALHINNHPSNTGDTGPEDTAVPFLDPGKVSTQAEGPPDEGSEGGEGVEALAAGGSSVQKRGQRLQGWLEAIDELKHQEEEQQQQEEEEGDAGHPSQAVDAFGSGERGPGEVTIDTSDAGSQDGDQCIQLGPGDSEWVPGREVLTRACFKGCEGDVIHGTPFWGWVWQPSPWSC